jgi:hypothetical protein
MKPLPHKSGRWHLPGYWMNETSGKLAPVVEKYLRGEVLTTDEVAIMRAYLRQWIAGDFQGVDHLRLRVGRLTTTRMIREWLKDAEDIGIDPL